MDTPFRRRHVRSSRPSVRNRSMATMASGISLFSFSYHAQRSLIYGFRQHLAGPAEAARSIILIFAALGGTAVLVDELDAGGFQCPANSEIVRRFHASLALSQLGSADRCNASDDSCARFRAHRTSARAALIWALFSERITSAYGSRRVFDVSCRFSEIASGGMHTYAFSFG